MRGVSIVIAGVALTFVMAATLSVGAQAPADAKKLKNPVAPTAASVTAGAATYKKYCSFCHGPEAKGEGALAPKDSHPPNLTDVKWDHGDTDGEIYTMMQNGAGGTSVMKGFKGKMPDQDMWNVVNYLRSLGPKKTS